MSKESYARGFCKAASAAGVDPEALVKLAALFRMPPKQQTTPPLNIGDLSGIPHNSSLNKYLRLIPAVDSHPTTEEWNSAKDRYKKLIAHPEVNHLGETQELMVDMQNAALWGKKPIDAHEQNTAALDAVWNLVHKGIPGQEKHRPDQKLTREKLFNLAEQKGNERFRNALYNGMTNRLHSVQFVPTYDKSRVNALNHPVYRQYLDNFVENLSKQPDKDAAQIRVK